MRSLICVMRSSSLWRWLSALVTAWAALGSSHRSGAAAFSFSSAICSRSLSGCTTATMFSIVVRRDGISSENSMATHPG